MTISLSGNPIVKHEARSQWRRGRAYWLLLLYAVLLAGLTVHFYRQHHAQMEAQFEAQARNALESRWDRNWSGVGRAYVMPNSDVVGAMAHTGRETFRALATLQAALWLLIAPALTATSIASEREAGLLEALQLTRLRAGQIVGGKLIACLWLVLLLILAALPPLSICFLMGGVAPEEFLRAAIVQLVAAISGASIGLFFSSRAPRPSWAMSQTFAVIALWSIAAYASFSSLVRWLFVAPMWDVMHELVAFTHPVSVLQMVLGISHPRTASGLSPNDAFGMFLVVQTLVCGLLLRSATRATARTLPAAMWIDRDRWTDRLRAHWQAERERGEEQRQRLAEARLSNEEIAADSNGDARFVDDAKMALLAEFPIERFVRFNNPVLRREVRHKFRWRKANVWVTIGRALVFLAAACVYVIGIFLAFDSSSHAGWWTVAMLIMLAQTPALAFMAATSFSREREAGTWESLNLSSLRPTEVLAGKLGAPMVTLVYYSVPFWPIMLLPFVRAVGGEWNALDGAYRNGPITVLTSLAVLAGSAFATTSWALLLSWLCRKTVTAVSCTIASLFAFHLGVPLVMPWLVDLWRASVAAGRQSVYGIDTSVGMNGSYQQAQDATAMFHPWQALGLLQSQAMQPYTYTANWANAYGNVYQPLSPMTLSWMNALLHFAFGLVMLKFLLFSMHRSMRERDGFRGQPEAGKAAPRVRTRAVTVSD